MDWNSDRPVFCESCGHDCSDHEAPDVGVCPECGQEWEIEQE